MKLAAGAQQRQQQRQIIDRAFLFNRSRCQIDGDAADGVGIAGVFQRRTHAVTGFPHSRVRETYHIKARQTLRQIRLHLHHKAVNPAKAHAFETGKHPSAVLSVDTKEIRVSFCGLCRG